MNYYMIQLSYTADAWRQQIELTRDHAQRLNAVRALIARLGGNARGVAIVSPDMSDADLTTLDAGGRPGPPARRTMTRLKFWQSVLRRLAGTCNST